MKADYDLLMFDAHLGGAPCVTLIESGASCQCVSEDWVLRHGFTTLPADPVRVAVPNGTEYVCNRVVQTKIKLGSYRDTVSFRVIPLAFGLYLGLHSKHQWSHASLHRKDFARE